MPSPKKTAQSISELSRLISSRSTTIPVAPVTSAVVIGAGIAGLATAALLARRGVDTTLVEKNSHLGGRIRTLKDKGFTWDMGPSWYLMPEAYDRFFATMGTTTAEQLDLVDLEPAYRVFEETESVDVFSGVDEVAELFEEIEPGAGQKIREYLKVATLAYEMSLKYFLYTTFSSVKPWLTPELASQAGLLVKLLTTSLNDWVEREFTDPTLRHILEYPAVFLANQPSDTPAMYHLLSHTDLVEGVRYPMGGFGTIVTAVVALAENAGVKIRTGCEVLDITVTGGRSGLRSKTQATGVRIRNEEGVFEQLTSDIVVAAGDLHHTETHLLPRHLQTHPESSWSNRNPGISAVVVLLGVHGKIPELLHHQLILSRDWSDDFDRIFSDEITGASDSIYVCMPSATDGSVAPENHENLFVLIPTSADPGIGAGTVSGSESQRVHTIAADAIDLIAARTGVTDLRKRIVAQHTIGPADFEADYHSWKGSAIGLAHNLRQSAFLRGKNYSSKVSNLYYAGGTTVPGVGVPMCLISAENVITRLQEEGKLS